MEAACFENIISWILQIGAILILLIVLYTTIRLLYRLCRQLMKSPVEIKKYIISLPSSKWSTVLSLLAIVISLICLCVEFPKTDELGFDYSGIIVGIFSLLVTLLIGWNIFSMIRADERIAKQDDKIKESEGLIRQIQEDTIGSFSHIKKSINRQIKCAKNELFKDSNRHSIILYELEYDRAKTLHDEYNMLRFGLVLIIHIHKTGNIPICTQHMKELYELFPLTKQVDKDEYLALIRHSDAINNTNLKVVFRPLYELIKNIETIGTPVSQNKETQDEPQTTAPDTALGCMKKL